MTRVDGLFGRIIMLSMEPCSPFKEAIGKLKKVQQLLCTLKKRMTVVKVVLGVVLLMSDFGGLQKGWAAGTTTPSPSPPTITKVEPLVTQPDGIVTLTFSQKVTPSSVKIGNTDASFVAQSAAIKTLKVKVGQNTPLGQQGIAVTVTGGAMSPLTSSVIVAPEVAGLKANKDAEIQLSRGAVAGGEIIIQFNGNIPSEIRRQLAVTIGNKRVTFTNPQNDYLVVRVPEDFRSEKNEQYPVQVYVEGVALQKQLMLKVIYESSIYIHASLVLFILILFIYLLYKLFYKIPVGQPRYTFLKMLLLEQENQTYSLSRAQFIGWLTVIIWSYLFLYYARGFVEQVWAFPNLGNAVYTFLISLGTLVVAQATSRGLGVKGAGEVHPSLSDLVVHGGVLALDRVQQVIWTLIALWMFLRITVTTYATATALPEIPQELLVLMGLSSAAYLGGKLVRGAGPVIEQVTVRKGSVILNIKGRHLSKDAFVWLDGVKQPKDNVKIIADDQDSPQRFAKEIEVTLAISLEDWYVKDHAITVINDDAQRAEWRTGPEIIEATPGQPNEQSKVTLTIKGARLTKGATLEVTGVPDAKPVQNDDNPNLFSVEVDQDWIKTPHELIVTSQGQKSVYTFNPGSS